MIDLSVVPLKSKLWNWNLWFRLAAAAHFPLRPFLFCSSTRIDASTWARGDTFLLAEGSEECGRANASSRSALTHAVWGIDGRARARGRKRRWLGEVWREKGATGCWVRQLILRQQVILFWFSTRDQAEIWILPAPSSFTFSHSSRGTHTHLFHPFYFSRSHTFVLYMLTQVRSWLGKQELQMKRKSLSGVGGGGVWETGDDRKKSTKIPVRICVAFDQKIPEANFHLFLNVHLICILTHKRLFSSIFWQYWTIVTAAPSILHLWMVETWRKKNNVTQIPALFKASSTFSTW